MQLQPISRSWKGGATKRLYDQSIARSINLSMFDFYVDSKADIVAVTAIGTTILTSSCTI